MRETMVTSYLMYGRKCSLEKNGQNEEKTKSNVKPNNKRDEANPDKRIHSSLCLEDPQSKF